MKMEDIPIYKDVKSEEDMLKVIRSVATFGPRLTKDLKHSLLQVQALHARVISMSCRFLKKLDLVESKPITNCSLIEPLVSVEELLLI